MNKQPPGLFKNIKWCNEIQFTINGKSYRVHPDGKTITATTTLNTFIRNVAQLKGTKLMCLEGGCCTVAVEIIHPVTKKQTLLAVNSCLVIILSCHGWNITTIEGVGNKKDGYNIIQKRLAQFNGTQCGFCSPGMVMNMYPLLNSSSGDENLTQKHIENSFGGNICRCTGYRSIVEGFKSFANDCPKKLLKKCDEIEDLTLCFKNNICKNECQINANESQSYLSINLGTENWLKVYKLSELLDLLNSIGNVKYMLVAGNTAHGVIRRDLDIKVFIDVNSIVELHEINVGNDIMFGANITITDAMNIMAKIAGERPEEYIYLKEIAEHYDLVANVAVRNIGTLAGNLMLKHSDRRFQSDIFLTLETFGAKLLIVDKHDYNLQSYTPAEFLDLNMNGKVLVYVAFKPKPRHNHLFRTYKIMPRAQNSQAIVNAGFSFILKDDPVSSTRVIVEASIVYGAINKNFIHAKKTEEYLIGKDIFNEHTLQHVFQYLDAELECDVLLPDPSPDTRKRLAISLFYKFIIGVAPKHLINNRFLTGGLKFDRSISSSEQIFETQPNKYPLTRDVQKIESLVQCSGEAKYVVDHDIVRNDYVFASFILANVKPGSIIKEIHVEKVMKIPGVISVITHKDIPGTNSFIPKRMHLIGNMPEEIFCSGEVKYNGQPIGLILAESEEIAQRGAKFVTIEYNKTDLAKQLVLTVRDAINSCDDTQTARIHSEGIYERSKKGNDVTKTIKGKFDIGHQYHFTMETQSCICIPTEDGMDVYPSAQWMDLIQVAISECCNIPEHSVNISVRRLGGGFGAKISRSSLTACACAIAANKLKRPVYIRMLLEDNMQAIGKRFPCTADYEIGVNNVGKIQYLNTSIWSDFGYMSNEGLIPFILESVMNCYDTATWEIEVFSTRTDTAANSYCRAPGTLEGITLIEVIMDHIATELNMDPRKVRLQNMSLEDENPLAGLLKEFEQEAELDQRLQEIDNFNKNNRWCKKGMGMVLMKWPFIYMGNYYAQVVIYANDGTVAVSHGGIEMGQGINTKVAQVVAYIFGIDLEKIQVKPSNNFVAPNNFCTGGSVSSESVCYATLQACKILNTRLKPIKTTMENYSWVELIKRAHNDLVDLTASYQFTSNDNVKNYSVYGITFAEVEIDLLTGQHLITRVDILEDTGESLSPNVDIGQIEGAFVMGLGYWLMEQIKFDPADGRTLTSRTWNYYVPGMKDIPIDWRIHFRKNSSNNNGVLRSKATGEPPLCMSVAVPLAIRRALADARRESDQNSNLWIDLDGPTTPSTILLNSLSNYRQYTLK